MLRKLVLTLLAFFVTFNVAANEIDKTQPYDMMKLVSERAFERLKSEQPLIHQDPNYLKVIVEEELMPFVNEKYAALKLLGPNLKGAKREDVSQFIDTFRSYLISSYAQVLTQYTDQTIEFGPEAKNSADKNIIGVKVDIVDSPRPNIKLEFKLRKDKNTGEWQVFDMIAEGISLLSSKQSEWSTKLRQEGIAAVADELEALSQQAIRFESKAQ
ncbi:phospholipid-binding protein MlaC [Vibrio sp. Hep-1b-8]|uniref:phospholipid-binding protein MlaC n=1 Tax=Vibrio sp. Hep-1b-8 TaxID=2144187 RepID=UPI001110DDA8|nr:phospholipid-binding protein MlaC [Vibrio sp. Hep-1b-8]TMX43676.1 phospholipid-binding protein MlaC [Vibrio sp. Hep-1b-8]